ncbi:MAG: LPS assembly lipoprotein LptE [Pseudomonadota bacterium]
MWSSRRAFLSALTATGALAGCGFSPLFSSGSDARGLKSQITVSQITGREGYFLRERLLRRFGQPGPAAPFVLSASFETEQEGLAITTAAAITRYNVNGTAEFSLRRIDGDGRPMEGTVRSTAGYSATSSPYATAVAERDALQRVAEDLAEKIANRVFLSAERVMR